MIFKVLSILFLIFISAYFTVVFKSQNILLTNISIIIFSAPTIISLYKNLKIKTFLLLIISLTFFALIIEYTAVKTGFPYGKFEYLGYLRPIIFNSIPLSLPFSYIPIALGAYVTSDLLGLNNKKIFSVLIMLSFDLVLDPAAVKLGFWEYENKGYYYNVPLSNFIGWILTGFISIYITDRLAGKYLILSKKYSYVYLNFFSITFFWTIVGYLTNLYIPAFIGGVLSGIILFKIIKLKYV